MENETKDVVIKALSPGELTENLQFEKERRTLISTYIKENLVEGTDYGKIHVMPKDKCSTPWDCKKESHFSKPCLFKPGAEKFCSLLQLRAEFSTDKETMTMLGNQPGVIVYLCQLVHIASENVIAEGRGACALSEKGGSANTAIKIAEKRAKIDAVLSLGLSDTFTKDLEDIADAPKEKIEQPKAQSIETKKAEIVPPTPVEPPHRASKKQLEDIRMFAFVKRVEMKNVKDYAEKNFKKPFEEISPEQAGKLMTMLVMKYGEIVPVS